MIKEAYCSYEVARLLKEKGFNIPTEMVWYEHAPSYNVAHIREAGSKKLDYFYWDEDTERKSFYTNNTNDNNSMPEYIIGKVYSAPTHQMAMAWLREMHGIDIVIEISDPSVKDRKYYCVIWDKNNDSYILDLFSSYEEAVEAALKYCLENLI